MRIRHFLGDFARACKVMRMLHQMKLYWQPVVFEGVVFKCLLVAGEP